MSLDIPADTAVGLYYVIAKADADGLEAETNEFNNTLGRVVSIGPDLMVSSLTAPASAGPGTAIAVSDTVKNQGGGAGTASTTRFYLSANTTLDAADVALTGGRAVPALAAGATSTGTTTADDPSRPRTTGSYYLFAKADADTAVGETQETNNTTLRLIQVGGDLVVTAMTVPLKAGAGTSIVVSRHDDEPGRGLGGGHDHALLPVRELPARRVRRVADRCAGRARTRRQFRQCGHDDGGHSGRRDNGQLFPDREGRRRRRPGRDAGRQQHHRSQRRHRT